MEEDQIQSDSQRPSQEETSRKAEQPPPQAALQTSAPASPSSLDQEESLTKFQEKGVPASQSQSQSKLLWKPIPPLLPEAHARTKDQSCQTEELTSTPSHLLNTGGKTRFTLLPVECRLFRLIMRIFLSPRNKFCWSELLWRWTFATPRSCLAKRLLGWLIFDTIVGGVSGSLTCCAGISNWAERGGGWTAAELFLSVVNIQYSLFDAFFAIFTCNFQTVCLTPPPL